MKAILLSCIRPAILLRCVRPALRAAVAGVLAAASLLALPAPTPASAAATSAATSDLPPVRSYEVEALGAIPAGCSTPAGKASALVSGERSLTGARSLLVNDISNGSHVVTVCPLDPRPTTSLSFSAYPAALPNGFLVTLLGHWQGGTGVAVPVFHLNITGDGAIHWYNGSAWVQFAAPGTVKLGAWNSLRLESAPRTAELFVGGTSVGTAQAAGSQAVLDITAYQLASNGTVPQGDKIFFDDLSAPTGRGYESEAVGSVPCSTPAGKANGLVSNLRAHTGSRSLRLNDQVTDAQTVASCPAVPQRGIDLSMAVYPVALQNGFLISLRGHFEGISDSSISSDNGRTWTQRVGSMTTPQAMRPINPNSSRPGRTLGGFVLVHGVLEDADGTLYQSGYGYYDGDSKYRQLILRSTDRGLTWTTRGTVAYSASIAGEGFCEAAIERVADGSLLAVMRTGGYLTMYSARSTDNGLTWSTPTQVVAGPHALPIDGVFPSMVTMPNGKLALYFGRPGQSVMISEDGSGASWSTPVTVDYRNSANGSALPIDVDKLLVFGDRGADWSVNKSPVARVWSRSVVIASACTATVTGKVVGPLTVKSGTTCVEDATITGPVAVGNNAGLMVKNSTLQGGLRSSAARTVTVCGSRVSGEVSIAGTSGVAMVGDRTRGCAPTAVERPVVLAGNEGLAISDGTR